MYPDHFNSLINSIKHWIKRNSKASNLLKAEKENLLNSTSFSFDNSRKANQPQTPLAISEEELSSLTSSQWKFLKKTLNTVEKIHCFEILDNTKDFSKTIWKSLFNLLDEYKISQLILKNALLHFKSEQWQWFFKALNETWITELNLEEDCPMRLKNENWQAFSEGLLTTRVTSLKYHPAQFDDNQKKTIEEILQKNIKETLAKQKELEVILWSRKFDAIVLLLKEIDLRVSLQNGFTLLHAAIYHKFPENILKLIIKRFRENNISLETIDNTNRTALDRAFSSWNVPSVKLLIKEGCDYKRPAFSGSQKTTLYYFLEQYTYQKKLDVVQSINKLIQKQESMNYLVAPAEKECKKHQAHNKLEKQAVQLLSKKFGLFIPFGEFLAQFKKHKKEYSQIHYSNKEMGVTTSNDTVLTSTNLEPKKIKF